MGLIQMKKIKSISIAFLRILVIVVVLSSTAFILYSRMQVKDNEIYGESGETTSSINADEWSALYSSYKSWTSAVHQDNSYQESENSAVGGYRCGAAGGSWRIVSGVMKFDVSGLPDLNEVLSMYVRTKVVSMVSYGAPAFPSPWLALVLTKNENIGQSIIQTSMHDTWIDGGFGQKRVSNWYNWWDYEADDYLDFEILDGHIDDILYGLGEYSGTYTYLQVVSQYQYNDVAPGTHEGGDGYEWNLGGITPSLYYTYAVEPDRPEFDYGTNAGYEPAPTGDEVADNLTLRTLSCMYADEDIGFTVHGESGAVISLELLNSAGTVLDSIEDEIRTDDYYYWEIDTLSSDYAGMVRARETNFNLYSSWVAIQPSPDDTEVNLQTYSKYTAYPQYANAFSSYVVDGGDYMYIHWKTNIDGSTESDNHRLDMYINGDNITPAYSENFTALGEGYMGGEADNWQDGINWRFAVFTMRALSGTNLYGGLVINLNKDYVPVNKGFIEPVIYKISTSEELAQTHTAYWYLDDVNDGILINLQKDTVEVGERINVKIVVGRECNASDYLSSALIELVGYRQTYGTIEAGDNWYVLDAMDNEGDYYIRVSLYDDALHSYRYIYQMPLSVVGEGEILPDGEGPGGLWSSFMGFVGANNLDSDVGHWIIVLLAMVALFLVAYKSAILRVALPLLVLGTAFVADWIDKWLIILLALGAGLALWGIFRKKVNGGGEGDG